MARVSASKRKREARKARTPGNHHTAAPKANPHETSLLRADQKRAYAERGLLEETKLQTDEIPLRRHRDLLYHFRHKAELPKTQSSRIQDDYLRRAGVVEIMEARVRAGIDQPNEPVLWAGEGVDITNGLRRKLANYFDGLQQRNQERNSQRRYLEWSLEQPDRNGIPADRVQWLKGIINQSVGPAEDMNMEARMRAFYYMLACARTVSSQPEIEWPDDLGKYEMQMHNWLLQQPCGFFEDPNFKLIATYPLDLDMSKLVKSAKAAYGGASKGRPVKIDSDDEADDEDDEESEVEFLPGEVGEMDEGDEFGEEYEEDEKAGPSDAAWAEWWAREKDRVQPEPVFDPNM